MEKELIINAQKQQPSQSYGYKEPAAQVSIQHNAPGVGGKQYHAVYDYSATNKDEVSFQDGDTIVNMQQIDDGWMYGWHCGTYMTQAYFHTELPLSALISLPVILMLIILVIPSLLF
uniref:SH3 domain-containing protein n=1 Tax=Monodelphis domestica TaxID=13616 RepID=A0A5F8HIW2_MONDO